MGVRPGVGVMLGVIAAGRAYEMEVFAFATIGRAA